MKRSLYNIIIPYRNVVMLAVVCSVFFAQATRAVSHTDVSDSDSIRGTVVDVEGNAVAFANVALLNRRDSVVIGGMTTRADGQFAFKTEAERVLLRVSHASLK